MTQEELSERCGLGVRTLRRMEAGSASKDSLRRVTQALQLEPEKLLRSPVAEADTKDYLTFDLLTVELAADLKPLTEKLMERVGSIRRFLAKELGVVTPGVRFRDNLGLETNRYRILVRELPLASGQVEMGRFLAVGPEEQLESLPGHLTVDPTYGLTAKWVETRPPLDGLMYFDSVSVIATHLTHSIRNEAYRLLGIDEVEELLSALERPHLVDEVIPHLISRAKLRAILQALLKESVSIRDLSLILETIADKAPMDDSLPGLLENVRRALGEIICSEYTNRDQEIVAVVLEAEEVTPTLCDEIESALTQMMERGLNAVLVVSPSLRPKLSFAHTAVLSTEEIPPRVTVRPWSIVTE